MTTPLLQLKGVHISYGPIHAIRGIDLDIYRGEIVTLLGGNGAGKTTTLRGISGLIHPTSGNILLNGHPIHDCDPHEVVRQGIAHSPEGRMVFANMTVLENLEMGAYLRREERDALKRDEDYIFHLFPRLKERRKQIAGTLSGGEQQMLALSRALMASPQLLLLDEPSLGIAPILVTAIFKVIQEINQKKGTTILLVEQNAHVALKIAHRGYVLATGKMVMSGTPQELLSNEKIQKAYLSH